MSDRDTAPDPMDKAYAQAEALLDDDAARAARRARVLAAVAEEAAEPQAAPRRAIWRHGGWLAAASVAGVSLLVAIQINRTEPLDRPMAPPTPQAPSGASATYATPVPPAAAQPATAPPVAAPPAVAPPMAMSEPAAPARGAPTAQDVEAPPPPPPPPPPLPERRIAPDPPPPSSMERRIAPAAPEPPAARAEAPAASRSRVEEVVVTGSRIEKAGQGRLSAFSSGSPGELGERLRAAADAGQASDLARLLSRGAPIDAADDDGETALMKAIQARQLEAVALLRRRGANLDMKNHAGRSARDMAAALADPKLDKALGLER